MKLLSETQKMNRPTYHIYLEDRCLFKDLNETEFDIIWGRLYHSYWDGLTYTKVTEPEMVDASY